MAESTEVHAPKVPDAPEVSPPEPGLTPSEIVARAHALIPMVRAQQDEAERLGRHTEEVEREFVAAGFYRMLQPRRFGGYEFDVPTFWKAMLAISTGDPGTGWGLTLGSHHALVLGAHFSAAGQREIFGPSGDFRGPHRPVPSGKARPVDGGYMVSGTWDYCSGAPYATHFMGNAMVAGRDPQEVGSNIAVVIPEGQFTVLDDWGDGRILGMNASGSNSVRVDEVFVPEHRTSVGNWTRKEFPAEGAELHGNPMYGGRIYAVYHAGLVIPVIGAARAGLAELADIITTKDTMIPPRVPRYTHQDFQQPYGHAMALADSAEALVLWAGERYMELGHRWAATGEPFTREEDARLYTVIQQAGQLAVRAVQVIFSAAGSSPAKRGHRLQRYYRDMSMYHGHIAAQYMNTAREVAKLHFGLPDGLF
jgi:3-hydroxy-9,10-secoandrosta-1,3,5(10)-triene-9,17-dione monooxygenase